MSSLKHLLRVVHAITNIIKHRLHVWQIVTSRRGGWCHELNGGFSWLLRELGFSVRVVSAQYWQVQNITYSTVQYSPVLADRQAGVLQALRPHGANRGPRGTELLGRRGVW